MTVLKLLMRIHDLTLHDMAEIFGVHFNMVAKWSRDENDIPKEYSRKISSYFGVNEDILQEEITSRHIKEICSMFSQEENKNEK